MFCSCPHSCGDSFASTGLGGFQVRDGDLDIVGLLAADAVGVGDGQVVVGVRPVERAGILLPAGQRRLQMGDGLLLVVGVLAALARKVGAAELELDLRPDAAARHALHVGCRICGRCQQLLAERNLLLDVGGLAQAIETFSGLGIGCRERRGLWRRGKDASGPKCGQQQKR